MSDQTEKLLTLKKVAKILGKHPITIRRYIKNDKLKATLVKGRKRDEYRISEKALQELAQGLVMSYQKRAKIDNFKAQKTLEFKELLFQHQQALMRLGQLENERLMLTERAESLQKREEGKGGFSAQDAGVDKKEMVGVLEEGLELRQTTL